MTRRPRDGWWLLVVSILADQIARGVTRSSPLEKLVARWVVRACHELVAASVLQRQAYELRDPGIEEIALARMARAWSDIRRHGHHVVAVRRPVESLKTSEVRS